MQRAESLRTKHALFDNARVVRRSELFALVEASLSVENDSKTSLTKDWKQVSELDINGDSNSWTTYPGLFAAGQLDIMTSWLLSVLSREFFVSSCSINIVRAHSGENCAFLLPSVFRSQAT